MSDLLKTRNRKRYRLHSQLRKEKVKGLRLESRQRTVYIPYTLKDLPQPLIELQREFGYGIQTYII